VKAAAEGAPERPGFGAVAVVYVSALLQGLTVVSFPASGAVLKEHHHFTDAQYGTIFLPQVAFTLLGSFVGSALARRTGLARLLLGALVADALSQVALGGSYGLDANAAFAGVLAGTALMGLGFGLSAAPLNASPAALFPRRPDAALVALHTVMGAGFALGPALVGALGAHGVWLLLPVGLFAATTLLAASVAFTRLPQSVSTKGASRADERPRERPLLVASFWSFTAIAVLYAFAEGTFGNWAVVFLTEERHVTPSHAALALSTFWAALAGGRLLVSTLVARVPAERIWLALPVLMVAAFLLVPMSRGAVSGVALFAFAGLSCSAFFPLTVGLASKRFPEDSASVSSLMVAALMLGVGAGSFLAGPLRSVLSLEGIYRASAAYPLAVLLVAAVPRTIAPRRRRAPPTSPPTTASV
jgi:fucose permease